ncbi:rod shape-determining protein MreC [Calothrix rhizosoleniae]|uniref:rod shape-determining protein MreC n=1 Tax=Calothrix rhizosoleniae TaxID=888997 RepID=UPI000B49D353|nr:rod shape-determining protein MreC [Calothrix rhizosoleniae]
MFTARHGWERRGLQIGLIAVVLGSAWLVRETQGAALLEFYTGISNRFQIVQTKPSTVDRLQNAKVSELQAEITDLQNQNQKLKKFISYTEKQPATSKPIPSRVVGRSADNWWQQVTINRGSSAGIEKGAIVKADGGLVGIVESVTSNTSRVLLITDMKSSIGVNISRTGAKGILRGNSSTEAVLEFYEKVPNVKVGDVITTSTYSQKFPSGLPIGKVKSLDLQKLPASIAKIELFPPISSLDWVAVYPKPEKQLSEKSLSSNKQPQKSN